MKKGMLICFSVLVAILMLFAVRAEINAPKSIGYNLKTSNLWYLSNISIDDTGIEGMTWEKALDEPWCSGGDGSSIDYPYIISNVIIDASDYGKGIFIIKSNKYFILENCIVNYAYDSGIWLGHVTNGRIRGNDISNNKMGITLDPCCTNNVIEQNNVYQNTEFGINIFESDHNYIQGNIVNDNGVKGINLAPSSTYNEIFDNTVNFNGWLGIHITADSSNNLILSNTVMYNGEGILVETPYNTISENHIEYNGRGIHLSRTETGPNSNHNIIADNYVCNNDEYGIGLDRSSCYNEIFDNTANFNGGYGIHMQEDSSNNLILSNTVMYNGEGISLRTSYNEISGNHIEYNGRGIKFYRYDLEDDNSHNTIADNYICNNAEMGIKLESSSDNLIERNEVINNYRGIYLIESHNNYIGENDVSNQRFGIATLFDSDNNYVENNEVHGCVFGIHTNYYSDGTQVIGNIVYQNFLGMSIYQTTEYSVFKNTIKHNSYGIWAWQCYDSEITENTFLENGDETITEIYGDAITIEECSNVQFSFNTIKESLKNGIYLLLSSDIAISNNIISENGFYGIYIDSNSVDNKIEWNDFIDNCKVQFECQAYDAGVNNIVEYNSWSDWTSPDIKNPIGIVDLPYLIDGDAGNEDPYPRTTVLDTPIQKIQSLTDLVNDMVDEGILREGQGKSLTLKLDMSSRAIANGNLLAARQLLEAFINQVNVFINRGIISVEEGELLISKALFIINQIS
ncbi:MAG: nitrous oxide reductase family maturation protein NosD [Candidatus Odinarchaeota archaeon]